MEDEKIIDLFFDRSEQAIHELDTKYGKVCHMTNHSVLMIFFILASSSKGKCRIPAGMRLTEQVTLSYLRKSSAVSQEPPCAISSMRKVFSRRHFIIIKSIAISTGF